MRRWPDVGLLLGQRRRRWANSKPTVGQRLMFAGYTGIYIDIGHIKTSVCNKIHNCVHEQRLNVYSLKSNAMNQKPRGSGFASQVADMYI